MIVVLIGPPGSGKGTQSAYISNLLNLPVFSTGDMLRKIVSENSSVGKLINSYISKGELVPAELVNETVKKIISSEECAKGCILDGFPRTIEQARFLSKINDNIRAIFFEIKEELLIKRIAGRYTCQKCGKIYNKFFFKPLVNGVCDYCKSENFTFRVDDDEPTILNRLKVYRDITLPVLNYYSESNLLYTINAENEKEVIEVQLSKLLKNI